MNFEAKLPRLDAADGTTSPNRGCGPQSPLGRNAMSPLKTNIKSAFATLFRHKEPEFYLLFTTRRGGAEILNDQYASEAERDGVGVQMMERFPEQLFYKLDIIYTPDGAVPKLTPL
jgi:hypothetical protein